MAVTGTPGTGKSTFAKRLASRLRSAGAQPALIEINDLVHKHKLYSGKDKSGAKIVRIAPLNKMLAASIKKSDGVAVVVGHLVPELRINQKITVVTRLDLIALEKRLKARRYGIEKMRENLISEAVDYCGANSSRKGAEQYQVESTKEKDEVIRYILGVAKGAKPKRPTSVEHAKLGQLVHLIDKGNKYGF
ncbi:MAG TPA: AAA family ATPase [Candidatus Baltobacteraceae bacterium]|nr:AAA family ATPase [Candidatus Baltobacteraceae bacterium]